MARKFILSFWNYSPCDSFTAEEAKVWADCGMTVPMAPTFKWGKSSKENLHAILDQAEKNGIKLLLQFDCLYTDGLRSGADEYRKKFTEIYNEFGRHPAVYGFYFGEEPYENSIEDFTECYRIQKEIAPELEPYMNLGSIDRTDHTLIKQRMSFAEWLREFKKQTGISTIGVGNYALMQRNENCTDFFFNELKEVIQAADLYDIEVWFTLLSSSHMCFLTPTKDEFRWQLNVAAGSGCKGVLWFRMYDKLIAADYHDSPIDEFGEKTQQYHYLANIQKRFNAHHGELLMTLKHKNTFHFQKCYGGYKNFAPDRHPLVRAIRSNSGIPGILSFFTDNTSREYIAIVNNSRDSSNNVMLTMSPQTRELVQLYHNGKTEDNLMPRNNTDGFSVSIDLCPGQMEIYRIG